MLDRMRAYFAKSGGLLLLILAFIIVGILAYLTIRAAQRGADANSDSGEQTPVVMSEPDNVIVDTFTPESTETTDTDESDTPATVTEPAPEPVAESPATTTETTDQTPAVSTEADLPNTGPAESAMLAASGVAILGFLGSRYTQSREALSAAARR